MEAAAEEGHAPAKKFWLEGSSVLQDAASTSAVAKWTRPRSTNSMPSRHVVSSKTWTFVERTELTPTRTGKCRFLRDWRLPERATNPLAAANARLLECCTSCARQGHSPNHPARLSQTETTKPNPKLHTSTHINLRQATSLMEALAFARAIGRPLNTHATIHWIGTKAGDDPDGRRFARVREGFDKWLVRRGVPDGLTAVWVRERLLGGSGEVDHDHMLLHLAHPFLGGRKHVEVVRALERLIDGHGDGNFADCTLKLTFPPNPDGVYLLKGGGPDVWRMFGVPRFWRKPQGFICGKRCGTTENIGVAARKTGLVKRELRHTAGGKACPEREERWHLSIRPSW
jgi:hypothetical protein